MNREEYYLNNRKCFSYHTDTSKCILIQPVNDHEIGLLDRQIDLIAEKISQKGKECPFTFVAFEIKDWNRELSPWDAPGVFGSDGFGHGADDTLTFVEGRLIPYIREKCSLAEDIPVILGGYSLAGLFSLWCMHQTDIFSAISAVSPSVWFPGWMEYTEKRAAKAEYVYLSLGDKEPRTRNAVMSSVGECICRQHELLSENESVKDCIFEWNEGNHFRESEVRCAKGFAWCLKKIFK